MARSKQRQRPRRQSAPKKSSGGGGGGPKPGQDAKAIKSMLIGMGLIAVLAVLLLMPIGGATAFNHFLNLFGGEEEAASAPAEATPPARAASAPAKPTGVKLTPALGARPMERVSDKEQADLDDLIEKARKK